MRFAPTQALLRAAWLGVALVGAAALLGRLDLALLAVPFVVQVAWSVAAKPQRTPSARPSRRQQALSEGQAVRVGVRLDEAQAHVTAAWPTIPGDWSDRAAVMDADTDEATLEVSPQRWGRYRLSGARVVVTDASLGWRADDRTDDVGVFVRPLARDLLGGSGVARPIGVTGQHTSAAPGDGSALSHVREFRPGDRLRRINWRVTSRTGALHVNATLTDRDTHVIVVADSLSDLPGAEPDEATSLDLMARAVAAVSQHYLGLGDRVRLHDLGHRIEPPPAGTGPRQARAILEALGRLDRTPAHHTFARRVPALVPGTLVFFCSPLLDRRALTELVRLKRLGAEVVAIDTFPERLGTTAALPAAVDSDSWVPEAWALVRLGRESEVALNRLGIPVVPWRGPASLAGVLLALASARSAPRAGARA